MIELMEKFLYKSRENAKQIMLKSHTEGKGVGGVYTQDRAETKVDLVNQDAQDHQQPLLCQAEPANDDSEDQ